MRERAVYDDRHERLALLALVVGCGDPALCTSDFRIAIDTTALVVTDFDPVAAGVQTRKAKTAR